MLRSQKTLSHILTFTLLVQPGLLPSSPARAEEGSTATTVLQGMTGALNTTNSVLSTIQASNAQMQALFGQFTNLQNQQGTVQQGLSALDATKQEVATALATAQACVSGAETKKTGKVGKYKNAKINSVTALANIEPTCENYGILVDSGNKLAAQVSAAMEKTACMMQLQNALGQAANKSKTAFSQAQQSATEVHTIRTSIITNYETMAKRIESDLGGENGYKAKLENLKKLSSKLYMAVNAGSSQKDGQVQGGGFAAQLRMMRANRTQAANTWYKTLMGEVDQCFKTTPLECRSGVANSPLACIAETLGSGAGTGGGYTGRVNAVQRAQGAANITALRRTLGLNASAQADAGRLAALDIRNQDQFLKYTQEQFDKMVSKTVNNFRAQTFHGNNVDKGQLGNFVSAKYKECYDTAVANYKADMEGEGGQYKAAYRSVEESEAGVNAEIKNMLDEAQGQMNEFRTSFNKIYNADLPQFASDCSASDNPYQSLDCLRMLSANLKSGIEGTAQTVKLDNTLAATGLKQATVQPPTTAMNIQTLTLDPTTGKPSMGNQTTSCVGFNECVTVLEQTQRHYTEQKTSQETALKDFVSTHNKSVQNSLGTLAAQFGQVGTLFNQEVQNLNKELMASGITASLKTKQVEAEALTPNDKTGLFDTPKDMKAAIASQGAFTELDSPEETQKEIREQANEIAKKMKDALNKKNQCLVKKGDYDAIANALDCSEANVCKGDRIGRLLTPLQALLHKSQTNPDASEKATISSEYNSCLNRSRTATDPNADSNDAIKDEDTRERRKEARTEAQRLNKQYREEEGKACADTALGQLDAKVENSVNDQTKSRNSDIMGKVRAVIDACPDADAAAAACRTAQSKIKGLTPPDQLDTKTDEAGGSSSNFTNPLTNNGSAK